MHFRSFLLLCALGCGLMAGVFFAFSVSVMPALADLPPAQGAAAMQKINEVIQNPVFFTVFFGATALCAGVLFRSLRGAKTPNTQRLIVASLAYLIGVFLVTCVANVPMNDKLAAMKAGAPATNQEWKCYVVYWTLWNHLRTLTSLIAAGMFAWSLGDRSASG